MQSKITATLILAGLLALTFASAIKPGGVGYNYEFPSYSFSFPTTGFPFFTANFASGSFGGMEPFSMKKMSDFTPSFSSSTNKLGDGPFRSITQLVSFPNLQAFFNQVTARLGFAQTIGSSAADFSDSLFNLTLTALTSNGNCVLNITITPVSTNTTLDVTGLSPLTGPIKAQPGLLAALNDFISNLVKQITPPILESLLKDILPVKLNVGLLCQEIANSNEDNCPQPDCCTC